jgi:hypothetical protein
VTLSIPQLWLEAFTRETVLDNEVVGSVKDDVGLGPVYASEPHRGILVPRSSGFPVVVIGIVGRTFPGADGGNQPVSKRPLVIR